jgi:hypothetical protein
MYTHNHPADVDVGTLATGRYCDRRRLRGYTVIDELRATTAVDQT